MTSRSSTRRRSATCRSCGRARPRSTAARTSSSPTRPAWRSRARGRVQDRHRGDDRRQSHDRRRDPADHDRHRHALGQRRPHTRSVALRRPRELRPADQRRPRPAARAPFERSDPALELEQTRAPAGTARHRGSRARAPAPTPRAAPRRCAPADARPCSSRCSGGACRLRHTIAGKHGSRVAAGVGDLAERGVERGLRGCRSPAADASSAYVIDGLPAISACAVAVDLGGERGHERAPFAVRRRTGRADRVGERIDWCGNVAASCRQPSDRSRPGRSRSAIVRATLISRSIDRAVSERRRSTRSASVAFAVGVEPAGRAQHRRRHLGVAVQPPAARAARAGDRAPRRRARASPPTARPAPRRRSSVERAPAGRKPGDRSDRAAGRTAARGSDRSRRAARALAHARAEPAARARVRRGDEQERRRQPQRAVDPVDRDRALFERLRAAPRSRRARTRAARRGTARRCARARSRRGAAASHRRATRRR